MQLRRGEQINHYTLLEPLGQGGQGSVWRVRDPRHGGVERALKIVSLADAKPSALDRVRREAKILNGANHPALVTGHGLFEERDGLVGLLMDLVPGRSLAATLDDRPLNRDQCLAVLGHLADALAYVHREGLVHRDLKPENVLLTDAFWEDPNRPATVKLVDFGIAASLDNETKLTSPGSVIGTIPYLAPEMIDPASWGRIEGPTRDIFAFGVLACLLLLGRHPTGLGFDAELIDYARAYVAAKAGRIAWPPSGIEGIWGPIVSECLALRASDRLADGAALLEMLRTGIPSEKRQGQSVSRPTSTYSATSRNAPTEIARPRPGEGARGAQDRTLPDDVAPPASYPPSTRPRVWTGMALVLVALLGAAGGALAFSHFSQPQADIPLIALPPSPTAVPLPALAALPVEPCRNPQLNFDPLDTRFACPSCQGKAPPLPSRSWWMRIHGVTMTPMPRPDLAKEVCAQIVGEPLTCIPFARLPDRTGALGRLRVSSSDISGGRVEFSIRDAVGTVATGYAHPRTASPFLESALCAGFVLVIDAPAVTFSVFLDDR